MIARWRSVLITLACTVVLLVAVYWSTVASLVFQWFTSNYSHALLVLPIAGYLAWRRRLRVISLSPEPSFLTLLWICAFAFIWLLGALSSTAIVQHFSLIAILVGLIWGEFGTPVSKRLALPLLFLFFAVPAGESLIPLLQDFSAWFAVKLLDLTRVPVLLEGRLITIPSGKWEVAEACSGLHYLLASLTIGLVYADIVYRRWRRRIAFLIACAVVPVLANGIRVYGIVLTDYLGGTRLARSTDHIIAGWIFLSVITVLLFTLGMRWREATPVESVPSAAKLPVVAEENEASAPIASGPTRSVLFATLALAVAAAAPLADYLLSKGSQMPAPKALAASIVSSPWSPTSGELIGWRPTVQAPDAELVQSYSQHSRTVELYIAYYAPNTRDTKLVGSMNRLFDENYWDRTAEGSVPATTDGKPISVREISIHSARASILLWNWYWIDGKFTSNKYETKWLLAKSKLTRSELGSAVIVAAVEEQPGGAPARDILRDFASHLSVPDSPRPFSPDRAQR